MRGFFDAASKWALIFALAVLNGWLNAVLKQKKMLALKFSHCRDWNDVSIEIKGVARPFNASNYF